MYPTFKQMLYIYIHQQENNKTKCKGYANDM